MTSTGALGSFGLAVRKARTAKGWTLDILAHEALGNQERKSFVSAVENGRRSLSALTIQKFARTLDLPSALVDAALGKAPAEVAAIEKSAGDLAGEVEVLRKELKLSEALVIALAHEFADGSPTDRDAAINGLRRALELARDRQIRGESGSNLGREVDAVLKRLAELTGEGRLDEASEEADRALSAWEGEQQEAKAKGLALLEAGIAQDYLRRDAEGVARKVVRKVGLDFSGIGNNFVALCSMQNEWYRRGRDKGLNLDLEVALCLARSIEGFARNQMERGVQRNILGNALWILGKRDSGVMRLSQAVVAYCQSLEERAREYAPLDWAKTQNNLGNALQALGKRETGVMRLEEAVIAYRLALEVRTRERVPLAWAMTQNNLGNALLTLGEREFGETRLKEAVAAYRLALEVRTRERVPLAWAMTQNNLGNALRTLGEREVGETRLKEAVTAYHLALEVRTRERVPLDWATAQNNLGNALRAMGERDDGTARLEEAVAAYRLALEERTRERVPLGWAETRENMAIAFVALFQRTRNGTWLTEGLHAVEEALEIYREAEAAFYIEKATRVRDHLVGLRDGD